MVLDLVVRHDLPLGFAQCEDFRNLMSYIYPECTPISRNTLLSEAYKGFKEEKNAIREAMKSSAGRVSVAINLWTSISNDRYMTLTAHCIDRSWVLHKKLIKFTVLTPPYSGENVCEIVRKILIKWGLEERLFSITVYNASANDVDISFLKSTLNAKNALVSKGEFFHVCCCAHILNLIVRDSIKLIDTSVQKVRDSVKFVKSSQARKVKFQECCENLKMTTNRGLHGDVSTRWNSTFQMLDDALYYRQAFDTLDYSDTDYTFCPTPGEWEKISKITKLLKPFDVLTKVLSGSKYPTSSLYFLIVLQIRQSLNDESLLGGEFIEDMVCAMREKFNKYWENYSLILSVAAVLDPRYKLLVVEWAYHKIHNGNTSLIEEAVNRVKDALSRLYEEYKSMPKEQGSYSNSGDVDGSDPFWEDYLSFIKSLERDNTKSELDRYLENEKNQLSKILMFLHIGRKLSSDILIWLEWPMIYWRFLCPQMHLSQHSVLGVELLINIKVKLLPKNVEALICLRDWIYDVDFGAEPDPDQDAEELSEALGDVFSLSHTPPKASSTTT